MVTPRSRLPNTFTVSTARGRLPQKAFRLVMAYLRVAPTTAPTATYAVSYLIFNRSTVSL